MNHEEHKLYVDRYLTFINLSILTFQSARSIYQFNISLQTHCEKVKCLSTARVLHPLVVCAFIHNHLRSLVHTKSSALFKFRGERCSNTQSIKDVKSTLNQSAPCDLRGGECLSSVTIMLGLVKLPLRLWGSSSCFTRNSSTQ